MVDKHTTKCETCGNKQCEEHPLMVYKLDTISTQLTVAIGKIDELNHKLFVDNGIKSMATRVRENSEMIEAFQKDKEEEKLDKKEEKRSQRNERIIIWTTIGIMLATVFTSTFGAALKAFVLKLFA